MSSDNIILGRLEYERGDDGQWYELEPTLEDGGSYWVGGPLEESQLSEALDEIERLRARLDECSTNLRLLATQGIEQADEIERLREIVRDFAEERWMTDAKIAELLEAPGD